MLRRVTALGVAYCIARLVICNGGLEAVILLGCDRERTRVAGTTSRDGFHDNMHLSLSLRHTGHVASSDAWHLLLAKPDPHRWQTGT